MKGINVPGDFGSLLLQAIEYLHKNWRSNIFYHLAKGIGTMHDDGSDSRLPVKRMPFGLVEYVARFFSSDNFQQVSFFPPPIMQCLLFILHRWANVLKILSSGKNQCMFSLVLSGVTFLMVLCGVYIPLSKDLRLSINPTQ